MVNLLDTFKPRWEELEQFATDCLRQAALYYERADRRHEAASCWRMAGEPARAAELYLSARDHERAAPLLLAGGHYAEALESYRALLAMLWPSDVVRQVTARLGIAACLNLMPAEAGEARKAYREARTLIEQADRWGDNIAARCWEALGTYGVAVGRGDLVQVACERALALYGVKYNSERTRVAEMYLESVSENRLLAREIEARLAQWRPTAAVADSGAAVQATSLAVGEGALFGNWAIWHTQPENLLLIYGPGEIAIRLWVKSRGWFTYSQRNDAFIVHSDGDVSSFSTTADVKRYADRVPAMTLSRSLIEMGNYALLCSDGQLRISHTSRRPITIVIQPHRSQFEFITFKGLRYEFPRHTGAGESDRRPSR